MIRSLREVWANAYVRVATGLLVLAAIFWFLSLASTVVGVFAAAVFLAYLCNPLVVWLEGRGARRGFGVAVVYLALLLFLYLVYEVVRGAVRQIIEPSDDGPALAGAIVEWLESLPERLDGLLPPNLQAWLEEPLLALQSFVQDGLTQLLPSIEAFGAGLFLTVSSTVAGGFQLFLVLVLWGYLLASFPQFSRWLLELFPRPYQATIRDWAGTLDEAVGGFIRGQLIIAIAVGLLVWLGLALLGLPLSGFIGFLAALLNVVPFLGTIVPIVPALLLAIGGGWLQVLLVLVVFLVANQIDNHVLTPQILGRSTDLHPLTVIMVVLIGLAVFGLWGAILAVPAAVFLRALYLRYYKQSRLYREG